VIIASIVLYAIFLFISDYNEVYNKLKDFKIDFLPLLFILPPISWLIVFYRWNIFLKYFDIKIPVKENIKIYFSGFALMVTPGKLGAYLRVQMYKEKLNVPRKITAPLLLVDEFYNLLGLIIISILGIFFFELNLYIVIIAAIVLVGLFFIMLSSEKFYKKLLSLLNKTKFTSKYAESLSESYNVIKRSTRGKILFYATCLSVFFWFVESLTVYFVLQSFDINFIEFLKIISMYGTSLILGGISLLPSGIGVQETSLAGLFHFQGIDLSLALVLVIVIRFFTLWYSVIVGFISIKLTGSLSK